MMLNNPRHIERDNQNALRKFPFADSASCTNGACVIVPGAIVDAQLYIPGRDPGRVWVSRITTDGTLVFADGSGDFAETAYPMSPETAVPVTFSGDGGPLPGGVVVFGKEQDVAALRSAGGQSFSEDQTEISPSALSWPGLPGVSGFRLDDGHVVFGAVRFRGKNGCEVSTYKDADDVCRLRISAVGEDIEEHAVTGFVTKVVAESDNTNFVVSQLLSDHVVDIQMTGVRSIQDAVLNADQDNVCSAVKKARGTSLSESATARPGCEDRVCRDAIAVAHKVTFMDGYDTVGSVPLVLFEGDSLGTLTGSYMPNPKNHPGKRFVGYFDKPDYGPTGDARLFYRHDGAGVGSFKETADTTLYAHWMSKSSRAEVTFSGYGTLHLAAPDVLGYENPLCVSGETTPPTINEISESVLQKGGSSVLADIILHPAMSGGYVTLGIRGIDKAYSV